MQSWSNQDLTSVNYSSDFLCPHCDAGSFEVIGVERRLDDQQQTECALVMRCLICLDRFWHLAETQSPSLQEPAAAAGRSMPAGDRPTCNRATPIQSTSEARTA